MPIPFALLGGLLKPLVSGIVGHFRHKGKMKEMSRQSEVRIAEAKTEATISRVAEGDRHAGELDHIAMKSRGWKDGFLLLITVAPLILVWVPQTRGGAMESFAALETMPEYYWMLLAVIYIDTFGLRRILRTVIEKFVSKRLN